MKKTLFVIGMLLCGLSLYAQDMKTLFYCHARFGGSFIDKGKS